ncbi:YozE family protein [Pedobacter steynii]|nr:YozE family protein [Pedobacter steynii]
MDNQQYSLDNIRNKAKKVKRELDITHTQALEVIAKKLGYSNWTHCCRTLSGSNVIEVKPIIETAQLGFSDWLKKQKNRDSPLGDLAKDMISDCNWPSGNSLETYQDYLLTLNVPLGATKALNAAWVSYKGYLKKQLHPRPKVVNDKNKVRILNNLPKIVYLKNIRPVHISKRTIEKFNPGDLAWISWEGRKAIPVTILDVDDRHYTFKIERPIKKAGNQHYLLLDEVRSTPELACLNYVTL